jgi:hypothetical protein
VTQTPIRAETDAIETTASPSNGRSRGCTPKRVRSSEEVEALARILPDDWRKGDQVLTWLKRHEGGTQVLSHLVRDGWSWDDVGRALAVAGIHYRSGEPISGAILRKKAFEARAAVRQRNAHDLQGSRAAPKRKAQSPQPIVKGESFQDGLRRIIDAKAAQAIVPPDSPARHEEPEFKFQPASLANWSGTRISRPEQTLPQPKPAPVLAPAVDVDAVIAALFGRGPPIMDSVPTPPANAAVGEGREQACSTHPTRAAPASTGSDLVAGSKRLVDQARALLEDAPPKPTEDRKTRIGRILSRYGPNGSLNKQPRR